MKVLFGIQGTGNGHISRCIPVIKQLRERGHQVDVLLSGVSHELQTPFRVTYKKEGLSYIFGKKGGIDLIKTLAKCNLARLFREIRTCPVHRYDVVISDFEPITAWGCRLKRVRCIGFGNQYAARNYPVKAQSIQEHLGVLFLKYFAPVETSVSLDYVQRSDNNIHFPEAQLEDSDTSATSSKSEKVVLYLPAHSKNALINFASKLSERHFIAFAKWAKTEEQLSPNLVVKPINRSEFASCVQSASRVITAAGFGLTSELIQLHKDMLIIPMKGQVEQKINAQKLENLGYSVTHSLRNTSDIRKWLERPPFQRTLPTTNTREICTKLMRLAV